MAFTKWVLDPAHSQVRFKVRHLMISDVVGYVENFEVFAKTDDNSILKAELDFRAEVKSLTTGNEERDKHLLGPEFFDAEKYPFITFHATGIKSVDDDGSYEVSGMLTIKDKTVPILLSVEFGGVVIDPWGDEKAGFSVSAKINRSAWGITWNQQLEGGGVLVSDEVRIFCNIQLVQHIDTKFDVDNK